MNIKSYFFTAANARQALVALDQGDKRIEFSVDLNLSRDTFSLDDDGLILGSNTRLNREELTAIAKKENRIFCLHNGQLEVLESRGDGYYKLVPTDQAPLLEISGVKMHISKGINPFESAGQMATQVVKRGHKVLDTCSGLGYAAIAAVKLRAQEVVSVELSETVIALRNRNPWSQGLLDTRIQAIQGNISDYILGLETEYFDAVIHDPPRFSLAGELYSEAFYRDIHRVLKRRGALFHYTGNPHTMKRGSGFVDNAMQRLKSAGFSKMTKVPALMGVVAYK